MCGGVGAVNIWAREINWQRMEESPVKPGEGRQACSIANPDVARSGSHRKVREKSGSHIMEVGRDWALLGLTITLSCFLFLNLCKKLLYGIFIFFMFICLLYREQYTCFLHSHMSSTQHRS